MTETFPTSYYAVEFGIEGPEFFTTQEAAREAVHELRRDLLKTWDECESVPAPWSIEKIEIAPLTANRLLALLNTGPSSIIASRDVVEIVPFLP
ncbi:hypothetical protein [Agrobacterium tumefaciens]|uniref:hypothetical protein n=1 Tax=Agrobacterium tumefaciens TaxID=358 RepID=UPI0022431F8D|nr:hypothetical protein [Agrobacterium tumefaciens]MCW8060856.1 hypothetical protein [Agrobacterium tumefaciens]